MDRLDEGAECSVVGPGAGPAPLCYEMVRFDEPEPGERMRRSKPNCIVGVGGSAGGMDAYKVLLNALPANTGMAFVIVSHIYPAANSRLAEILSRHTQMLVVNAADGMQIYANRVYVLTANTDLTVAGTKLNVVSPRSRANISIDIFFTSLAMAMEKRAIGIVLSGYQGDGAVGCRRIKDLGGITFAQDGSAQVNEMPLNAQATGCVDYVMSPAKIADELVHLAIRYKTPSS